MNLAAGIMLNIFITFADKPERMMLVSFLVLIVYAFFFGIFYFKNRKVRRLWPMLAVACLWFCWGLWENYCQSIGANIRVDIMLLLPFVFGLTIGLILCQAILLMSKQ